jgi:putative FmdB family regulatory protein
MPIYEYECTKCGHRFEKIESFSARRARTCPECKGRLERTVNAPAIQFKGAGWYVNDYAGKDKPPKSESTPPKDTKPAGGKDAPKAPKSDA